MADIATLGIAVDSRNIKKATDDLGKLERQSSRTESSTKKLESSFTQATTALTAMAAALATAALASFARDVFQASVQLERINNSFMAATGNALAAGQEMSFVRGESDRLGLSLQSMAKDYGQLLAAGRAVNISAEDTRNIFTAISEASTTLGLSTDDASGAIRAITQMMSKGKIAAEELRGQLGERIPGALPIMARALGVTTMELDKMLAQGEVLAKDALPAFAAELRRTYSDALPKAMNSAQANVNRLETAIFDLKTEIGTSGFMDVAVEGIKALKEVVEGLNFALVETRNLLSDVLPDLEVSSEAIRINALASIGPLGAMLELLIQAKNNQPERFTMPPRDQGQSGTGGEDKTVQTAELNKYVEALQFEYDQLGRSEILQRMYLELRKAGVSASSEEGEAIQNLVTRIHAKNAALEANIAREKELRELADKPIFGDEESTENLITQSTVIGGILDRFQSLETGVPTFDGIFDGLRIGISGALEQWEEFNAKIMEDQEAIIDIDKDIAERKEALAEASAKGLLDIQEDLNKDILDLQDKKAEKELDIEKKKNKSVLAVTTTALDGIAAGLQGVAAAQDQSSRDGFETAKKLNLGVAVMSTAAAIIRAFSDLGWPAGIPAAALAAATGAAQISAISSASFGSGASAPSIGGAGGGSSYGGATIGQGGGVLGSSDPSRSIENSNELLEDIHAKEYSELRAIAVGIEKLNDSSKGLTASVFRDLGLSDLRETYFNNTTQRIYEAEIRIDPISIAELQEGNELMTSLWMLERDKHEDLKEWTEFQIPAQTNALLTKSFSDMANVLVEASELLGTDVANAIDDFSFKDLNMELLSKAGEEMTAEEFEENWNAITSEMLDVAFTELFGQSIKQYQQVGEALAETGIRVASTKVVIGEFLDTLGASYNEDEIIATTQALADFGGGLTDFQEMTEEFMDAFYTDAEKFARLTNNLEGSFADIDGIVADLNISLPATREEFRELMESFNLDTTSSQDAFTQLLDLTGQLDEYYSHLEDLEEDRLDLELQILELTGRESEAVAISRQIELEAMDESLRALQLRVWQLQDEEDAAEAAAAAEKELLAGIDEAYSALVSSVNKQKNVITEAYNEQTTKIQEQIQNITTSIAELETMSSSIGQAIQSMFASADTEQMAFRSEAKQTLLSATGIISSGGEFDSNEITNAIATLSTVNESSFASSLDYKREFYQSASILSNLKSATDGQLSVEQKTLSTLERSLVVAEDAYNYQIASLDSILTNYESQINELKGINSSVLTVNESIIALDAAIRAYNSGGIVGINMDSSPLGAIDNIDSVDSITTTVPNQTQYTVTTKADPELVSEIKSLREETQAANLAIARNTLDVSKLMKRWDGDGLPAERSVA